MGEITLLKKIVLSVIVILLFTVNQAKADSPITNTSTEYAFSYTLTDYSGESGWVIKRSADYDYSPAVVKIRGSDTIHMWFCGGGGSTSGDSIWYTKSDNNGTWGSWSTPVEVIRPSVRNDYLDAGHICDPSVTEYGGYYYIMYTGSPNWISTYSTSYCTEGGTVGCDNRIFIARVPYGSFANRNMYQKMSNVGECTNSSCFQWKYFWSNNDLYPPVPIIRNEIGPVWRRIGTGSMGYTTPQTNLYGIGQPSQVSISALRVWFTYKFDDSASVHMWIRGDSDIANAYSVQDYSTYNRYVSNTYNDVNYDVAFNSSINRYMATTVRESPPNKPCVHVSHIPGYDLRLFNHIISDNLMDQSGCFLSYAETDSHNSAFLRDQWGYMITGNGTNSNSYYWLYYSTNISQLCGVNCGNVDINRVPFTLN